MHVTLEAASIQNLATKDSRELKVSFVAYAMQKDRPGGWLEGVSQAFVPATSR